MKKIITIIICISAFKTAKAQLNLVPNSSFEDTLNCIESNYLMEDLIFNWFGGKGYYNSCRSFYFGVPANVTGHQYPRTGNGYCGIYTRGSGTGALRNYIQIKLSQPLLSNNKYLVEFYISLGDTMHANCNSIGAYLSPDSFLAPYNNFLIDQIPQIQNPIENDLSSKTDWTLVGDTFVATGVERWLTIGNFYNDSLSTIIPLDSVCAQPNPFACAAYFYIDDVSVTLIDETGINEQKQNEFSLFPNPNNGNFKLQYKGNLTKSIVLFITDVYGKLIDNIEILNSTTDYENASLNDGLYFYSLRQGFDEVGKGKIIVLK